MKLSLGILLASLAASSAFGQVALPRSRNAQALIITKGGSYLGIGGLDITSERAKALNLKEERGVEVSSVAEDGPAAKAGIKAGDVVLEFDGQPVQGTTQFQRMVRETPVGRQVKITVWRGGALQTVTATVGENKGNMISSDDGNWNFSMPTMPPMPPMADMNMPRMQIFSQNPMLGIEGESLGQQEQLAEFFGVQDGVLVRLVKKGSPAEKAGLKAGDVITKIDDSKVASTAEITRTLRTLKSKKSFTLTITRNKKEMPLTVTMDTTGAAPRAALEIVNC
uniref:PDZ/DHR/GLGF domain protein n=1 Tax=Solibacter usitatus (strain Ellin6076) TaxID=234267 RepID=Q01UK0_SOLUE